MRPPGTLGRLPLPMPPLIYPLYIGYDMVTDSGLFHEEEQAKLFRGEGIPLGNAMVYYKEEVPHD